MTRKRAHLIIAFLAICASANYLPSKLALHHLDPLTLVAYRFGIGAIATFLLFPRQSLALTRSELRRSAFTGLLFGVALLPLFISLRTTHSGVTAFLVGGCALFVPFFEYLAMRRVPTRFQVVGLTIGLIGMALLTVKGDMTFDGGSFWGLLSAVVFALWAVSLSFFGRGMSSLTLGLGQIYSVTAVFVAIALVRGTLVFDLPPLVWAAILYLGIVGVAIRFLLQSYAQTYTTATSVEIIFLLEPLFAFLWATLIAREVATFAQAVGCGIIVTGILLAQRGEWHEPLNS